MKKALTLILAVLFVMSISFALVSCNTDETETTTTTTEDTTTTTEETTTSEETTTTTTTETTTTTTTTTETTTEETTTTTTTTVGIFARFDFGTKTYAEDNGLTSNEYLMAQLSYNKAYILITNNEDSWTISALKGYTSGTSSDAFALCFDDILTFDFDDELLPGGGNHVYLKVRIKNNSKNNMIGFEFRNGSQNWATTLVASNMYLQGGEGLVKASAVSNEWKTYTYDIRLCAGLASGKTRNGETTWNAYKADVTANGYAGNNWIWQGQNAIAGLRFHLLGAYSAARPAASDSRSAITNTSTVEIDYILFGHTPEQLAEYHSYIESSSLANG